MKKVFFVLLVIICHYTVFSLDTESYKTTHRTMDNLHLRSESNVSSSVITTLNKDTAIQVLETGENQTIDGITAPWVKVLSETGYEGWCFSGYLSEVERVDDPFDFKLGNDVTEIIANLGEPKTINSFDRNDNKYTHIFYDNIRINLWYVRENEDPLMTVIISSPSFTVFNGIHVGMNFDEAEKIIGEPEESNEIGNFYRGNTHYIIFRVDQFNQIYQINWTYFLD